MKKIILSLVIMTFPVLAWAQVLPKMEFYHGKECPHCHKQHDWLPELQALYPDLEVEIYEVWHDQANQTQMQERLKALGKTSNAVPTNIIQDEVIVGFDKKKILETLARHYGKPKGGPLKDDDAEGGDLSWWSRLINWFKNLF